MIPVMSRCEVTMKSISMVGQWDVPGHLLPLIHLTITLTAYNMGVYIYTLHVCIIFLYMSHTHTQTHTHNTHLRLCIHHFSAKKKPGHPIPEQSSYWGTCSDEPMTNSSAQSRGPGIRPVDESHFRDTKIPTGSISSLKRAKSIAISRLMFLHISKRQWKDQHILQEVVSHHLISQNPGEALVFTPN